MANDRNGSSFKEQFEAEMVRRLAGAFEVPDYVDLANDSVDTNELAGLLWNLDEDEAEMLFRVGLIEGGAELREGLRPEARVKEALRFLETHGRTWFEVRLQRQIEELRRTVERIEKWRAKEARTEPRASISEALRTGGDFPDAQAWLSIGEVASILGKPEVEVLTLTVQGPLEATVLDGELRLGEKSVEAYQRTEATATPSPAAPVTTSTANGTVHR